MKILPIAMAAMLLQGTTSQRPPVTSIEGIVVKIGAADIRLQFSSPEASTRPNSKVTSGIGEPLSGATVELTTIAGDRVRSFTTRTGRDGKFNFRNVAPGEGYQLVAFLSPEYLPAQYGQRYPGMPGTSIALGPGQNLTGVRIAMTRGGEIEGHVFENGNGWPGMVYAIRPFYEDGRRVLGAMSYGKSGVARSASSNKKGEFKFSGLSPGQYYICVSAGGQFCAPAPIDLRAGGNVDGVKIHFVQRDFRSFQGPVINRETNRPVASARIAAVPMDAVPNPPTSPFRNSPSPFTMTVRPGSYFLVAAANENGIAMFGVTAVKTGGSAISQTRIVVEPPFTIPGQLEPRAVTNVTITLQPRIPGMPKTPIVVTSSDGAFVLRDVTPGEYRVDVSALQNPDSYVKSIRFGGREIVDSILQLPSHMNGRLEISMGTNAGTVTGQVSRSQNGRQTAIAGSHVVLVPERSSRGRQDLYRNAFSDESGKFVLTGVAPGSYKLFAWELVQDGAWFDPEFLRLFEDSGKTLRVEENRRESVEIDAILPWR